MVDNELSSISLRDGGEEITLKRPTENGVATGGTMSPQVALMPPQLAMMPAPPGVPEAVVALRSESGTAMPADDVTVAIESPMVGTFYSAPNPEAGPFVEVGSRVSASTVVCIIEAMKVFNEIRAEVSGTIEKLLVTNQQAVEYGQPLFSVRPD